MATMTMVAAAMAATAKAADHTSGLPGELDWSAVSASVPFGADGSLIVLAGEATTPPKS